MASSKPQTDQPSAEPVSRLGALVSEMQRRRVFRVATAYAVVAFILLQIAEITFDPLALPPWALTALILAVVLLFPLVMALAWIFDLTPQGIRRTEASEHTSRARAVTLLLVVVVLDGGAAWFLYHVYAPQSGAAVPAQTLVPATRAAPATPVDAPPGSVAVMPFVDLSDGDQGYFAEGLSVDVQALLARCEGVHVPRLASSRAVAERGLDIAAVGTLLNVGYVLEGTVRRDGERLRVTTQLFNVATGFADWSETFDRPQNDVLAIQEEIVTAVSERLTGTAAGVDAVDFTGRAPGSFEAFDRYQEGRALWRQRTPESLEQAIEIFKEVIDLDPQFAPARSGLGDAYLLLASYGDLDMTEAIQLALPQIMTAIELDGELSEARASVGLLYWNTGRTRAAEEHLREAIRLDPDNIIAYAWLGGIMGQEARLGEQEVILRQGLARDPVHLLLSINLANNLLMRGQRKEGFQILEETRRIYPTTTLVLRSLGHWQAQYGRLDEALALHASTIRLAPNEPPNYTSLASILVRLGALDAARRTLDRASSIAPNHTKVAMIETDLLWRSGRRDELRRLVEGMLEGIDTEVLARYEAMMPEYWLARILLDANDVAGALDHFSYLLGNLDTIDPAWAVDVLAWASVAQRRAGDDDAARVSLEDARRRMEMLRLQGMAIPEMAFLEAILAVLGADTDSALAHLGRAAEAGWFDAWTLENDPRLADVRTRPGFELLVGQIRESNAAALAGLDVATIAAL